MFFAFARILLRFLFRVEVRGSMTPHDRLLVIANHQSFLDVVLMAAYLPVKPVWMVHTSIAARWYFKPVLALMPHVVADTTKPMAMKVLVHMVESGTPVLIFPEGRITTTGSMMKIYDGPAFLAARTGAQVVVVHIEGAVHSKFSRVRGGFSRRWFPRIRVTIHEPRVIAMPAGRSPRIRRRLAAEQMRRMLQEAAAVSQPSRSIFEAFLDAMEIHGRGRGLVEGLDYKEQTYGELLKTSLAIGRMVSKLSAEGETVGVLMPTVGTTLALMLGMFAFRRVPAMLNYTAGSDAMNSACRAAKVRTLLTSRAFLDRGRLTTAAEKLTDVRVVCLEDLKPQFGMGDKLWVAWAMMFPRRARRRVKPEDPAAILFTSGSERKPKGVVLSHASILSNVAQLLAVIDCTCTDKILNALPLFHSFGFTIGAVLPAVSGCRVVFYPTPLHYRVIPEMIYDRDCTIMFATNTFLGNYARFGHPSDFRRVRLVGSGAEKLTDDVRTAFFDKFGIRVIEGYGATECSPVIAVNTPMTWRAGSVGEALPHLECRIEPVPGVSEGGILHVRGPNVMLGYMREEKPGVIDPPSSVFGPGWYDTGDVVNIDADGFLHILGRMRRFAKVSGEMVSLEVSEGIAAAASAGILHAASSRTEPGRGESIVLFTEDKTLTRERLLQAGRDLGAPEVAIPRKIVVLEKIPLLGNGKKDYVALDAMANAAAGLV